MCILIPQVFAGENLPLAPGYIDYLDTEPKDLTPIIGGVIGGILGLLLIVGVLVYCWRRPKTDESKRSLGGGDEDYQSKLEYNASVSKVIALQNGKSISIRTNLPSSLIS